MIKELWRYLYNRFYEYDLDGSKLTFGTNPKQHAVRVDEKYFYMGITAGAFNGYYLILNTVYIKKLNLNKIEDLMEICQIISHEYLHKLLDYQFGDKTTRNLDNICNNVRDGYTECGGI